MSASGNSANSTRRRNDFFGVAAEVRGPVPPARGGSEDTSSGLRSTGRSVLDSAVLVSAVSGAWLATGELRSRRCTLASPARAFVSAELPRPVSFKLAIACSFFSCNFFSCNRQSACFRQIGLQLLQCAEQALGVGLRHSGQRLSAGDLSELGELDQFRARRRRQLQTPHPPVGGMRMPRDQPLRLQLVDDAAERDRLDLQQLSPTALVDPFVLRQVSQDLPLRPRQPRAGRVLLEAPLQQACDLVQQESKRWRIERWRVESWSVEGCRIKSGRVRFHAIAFISKLIISLACYI